MVDPRSQLPVLVECLPVAPPLAACMLGDHAPFYIRWEGFEILDGFYFYVGADRDREGLVVIGVSRSTGVIRDVHTLGARACESALAQTVLSLPERPGHPRISVSEGQLGGVDGVVPADFRFSVIDGGAVVAWGEVVELLVSGDRVVFGFDARGLLTCIGMRNLSGDETRQLCDEWEYCRRSARTPVK